MKRRYGWKPDRPDHRDFLYKEIKPRLTLPSQIDLTLQCSPVENQGELGSCTAQALVGNLEFLELKEQIPYLDLSRLFIYYNERLLEGTIKEDSGAMLRDGIKSLVKMGYCAENMWDYDIKKFAQRPPIRCYFEARHHRIREYRSLLTQNELLTCLAEGYPFVFGISIYESFESEEVAKTGKVPMPSTNESNLGGHAVMCAGHNDNLELFTVRNSWGKDWGDKGYFYMPYKFISKYASDFWTLREFQI
jgi:C1A family cysteine protease